MGRPPSNGGPSFRFNQSEIVEMEAILQAHKAAMPAREVLVSLAEKFSNSEERKGKIEVQMKQVWNWFQNRRYAIRAKAAKSPGKLNITPMTRDDSVKGVPQATQPHVASSATVRSLPQAPQHSTGPSAAVRTFSQAPQHPAAFSVQSAGRVADNSQMEYEAKSARDGAWYDVSTFLSHRSLETGDPEVLVRFAGFGAEEDEWVNVRKNVRQRSLPCESSECVAVLPADLILCFQEGKEQALYFDAHVLDAQRRRHDVRGCRCRFLVRYDHDQSEEIVALRKICRRPETDYRLQQLHAVNESLSANHNKNGANNIHTVSTLRVYPPAEVQPKQHKVEPLPSEAPQKRQKVESTPPEPSQTQLKVEPDVPQNQHSVQLVPPASSAQPLLEPQKVEPAVPSPLDQASLEPQNAEPTVATGSDEVPPELHKVQPVLPDPSPKASVEPDKVKPVIPVETTAVEPSQDHHKAEPASLELQVGGPEATEPLKELMVSDPLVKVQEELHEVQPDVTAPTNDLEVIEVGIQQPELSVVLDGNKGNVDDNKHAKVAETVSNDNPLENAKFAETGSYDLPPENTKVAESSDMRPENAEVADTGSSDLPPENAKVAETGSSDLSPVKAKGAETQKSDVSPENAKVAETEISDTPLENAAVGGENGAGTVEMEEG